MSASVRDREAIEEVRAAYINFAEKARDSLDTVLQEARRFCDQLTHDKVFEWKRRAEVYREELSQAKSDLFRRRLRPDDPSDVEQKEAVQRSQRRLNDAEEKIEKCKKWGRIVEHAIDQYVGQVAGLEGHIDQKPPKAVLTLDAVLRSIDSYLAVTMAPKPIGEMASMAREVEDDLAASSEQVAPGNAMLGLPGRKHKAES